MSWDIVIGIETHVQLTTQTKIFSGASTSFGMPANENACLVSLAYPGTLPVLNKEAVKKAIKFGLAVNADIAEHSVFARKNYFYPDLPKGYQISQFELPVVNNGFLTIGDNKKIRILRAHLEEDAGKSVHGILNNQTGIDLNRAGTPLLEIVTEPDMNSAQEAIAYAKKLHNLVQWIGVCDGNMQEGSFRCDVNVSVKPSGSEKLGTRREIKNLNSFKKGLPSSFRNADGLMKQVRRGMNLAASYGGMMGVGLGTYRPIASLEQFEQNQVRDLYVREMIFNINDKVDYVKEDISGTVKRRGTNYIVIEDNNNNLHKAWIWDCLPVAADREVEVREYDTNVDYGFTAVDSIQEDLDATPQDKDVKKKKGTQPKKYYSGLSKDVKDKRADHFKKDKYKKGDTDYKPAPGDKDAKTKPSIHTKKFKQMYGEVVDKLDEKGKGLWHNIHMKRKRGERMRKKGEKGAPTTQQLKRAQGEQKEAYDIGHDYANYAAKITPGEPTYDPKHQGGEYKPSNPKDNLKRVINSFSKFRLDKESSVEEKDVKEWAMSDATIDKYKERYKEIWREKLDEVVKRMMDKI